LFPNAGGQKILCGCFSDEYVKRDEQWYFHSRHYETLYRSTVIEPAA
jgi:guanyl-specific ribonuclease Sa